MEGVGSACPPHGALGWDMVAAAPALLWQNWGAFMGYSAGTSSGPPVPRIQCIQCILGVAHLLKVEAGNLCKKRPDPTSCPRPGGIHDHWGGKEPDLQVPGQVRVPSHQAGLRPVRDSPWGESPLARSVPGRRSVLLLLPASLNLVCLFWPVRGTLLRATKYSVQLADLHVLNMLTFAFKTGTVQYKSEWYNLCW